MNYHWHHWRWDFQLGNPRTTRQHVPFPKLYCRTSAQAAERGEIVTLWQLEMPTFEGFVKESKRNCHVYRFMWRWKIANSIQFISIYVKKALINHPCRYLFVCHSYWCNCRTAAMAFHRGPHSQKHDFCGGWETQDVRSKLCYRWIIIPCYRWDL